MKIALVISSLSLGGAERVLSILANRWAEAGHELTVVTLDQAGSDVYELSAGVARVGLGLFGESRGAIDAIRENARRVAALRRVLGDRSIDVAVSFMDRTNVLMLLATIGTATRTIVSERVDPRQHDAGRLWSLARTLTYARADALVVQVRDLVPWGARLLDERRTHVIPNPVEPARSAPPRPRERIVLAMGRLTRQKGFDLLIRAFATLRDAIADGWKLVILGEGEARQSLETIARELGISAAVELPGRVADPSTLFERASIFVLSSRYEGFPNALLEAMAAGMPAVAFDCPTGPSEIVRQNVDGVLVENGDVGALGEAIRSMISNPAERSRLGEAAREVSSRFSVKRVMEEWNRLLADVTRRSS